MVTGRKHYPHRKQTQENSQEIPTKNSYNILNQLPREEEVGDPHKKYNQEKGKTIKTSTKQNQAKKTSKTQSQQASRIWTSQRRVGLL
jgi:hypothetical protein